MRTKTTVKPSIKILQAFSTQKEVEQYQLPKETGLSYRTILRELEPMEKRDYIKLVRTEKSAKRGKKKKIYALTFKGFIYALINAPNNRELILNKHPDMLLISEKLPSFETAKIKPWVLKLLDNALAFELLNSLRYMNIGIKLTYPSDQAWRDEIDSFVIRKLLIDGIAFLHVPSDIYYDFLKLCKQDKELDRFISKILEHEIKEYELTVRFKESWDKLGEK